MSDSSDAKSVVAASRARQRRLSAALLAAVMTFGVGIVGLSRWESPREVVDSDQTTTAVSNSTTTPPANSTTLASSADGPTNETTIWDIASTTIGGEFLPSVFWTGSRVTIIRTENGGNEVTGEQWDPATNESTQIAASGLAWRTNSGIVWTGEEIIVVGGSNGPGFDQVGAAYTPATDSWRPIADPPGHVDAWENRIGGPAIWTGDEMILWEASLLYNPTTDSWRSISQSPLSTQSRRATVWTGSQIVVWGGCTLAGAQCDERNEGLLSNGAMYDPATDTWAVMPPSPLAPAVHMVADWDGSNVVIVITESGSEDGSQAATFDPQTLQWATITAPPIKARRNAAGIWAEGQFVIWGGRVEGEGVELADGASYDPATRLWSILPDGPGPGRSAHTMIDTGELIYISATRNVGPPLLLHLQSESSTTDPQADGSFNGYTDGFQQLMQAIDSQEWANLGSDHSVGESDSFVLENKNGQIVTVSTNWGQEGPLGDFEDLAADPLTSGRQIRYPTHADGIWFDCSGLSVTVVGDDPFVEAITEYTWSALDCDGATATVEQDLADSETTILSELSEAKNLWSKAKSSDYELEVAELENYWSKGCVWLTTVAEGLVVASSPTGDSSSACSDQSFRVETLHARVEEWHRAVEQASNPEFGRHTLEVDYDTLGVPTEMRFDLANGSDEESTLRIRFTQR